MILIPTPSETAMTIPGKWGSTAFSISVKGRTINNANPKWTNSITTANNMAGMIPSTFSLFRRYTIPASNPAKTVASEQGTQVQPPRKHRPQKTMACATALGQFIVSFEAASAQEFAEGGGEP